MINTLAENRFRLLSGSMLKLIAVLCMTIDHAAAILWPVIDVMRIPFTIWGKVINLYWIMRKIGRLAFPIFCFLISEGYVHTKNKAQYGLRLLLFAIISEIPFNLLHGNAFFDLSGQNVFFTLFFGLLLIHIYEAEGNHLKKLILMVAVSIATSLLKTDYGLHGALLVFLIYLFRNTPSVQALLAYPLLSGGFAAWLAFVPINLYNGKRGFIKTPFLKLLFYIFYPFHILVLFGIRHIIK